MMSQVGVWLDRSKAFIVSINGSQVDTVTLKSDMEIARHPRCGTKGRCTIIPERRLRNRKKEVIKKFYRRIIFTIKNADSVLILGPGTAKNEIVEEIRRTALHRSRIVGLGTTDKMSSIQVERAIKKFYA
jgi:stalled ribosome rescue protein Dom34